jgi:Gluconate 2-dehydrogenase subunit 3
MRKPEKKNPAATASPAGQGEDIRTRDPESHNTFRRRDMLKAISAVPAAALVSLSPAAATPAHAAPPSGMVSATAQAAGAYKRKILDDHEWQAVRILSDWIIPADERSGSATDAGVPEFVDDWLDFKRGETLDKVRGGLTWLDLECNRQFHHDFADCTKDQQKRMLDRIAYPKEATPEDAAGVTFFNEMRNLAVSGFFSSKMGVEDLPYLGNKMLTEWNGCPPEVLEKLGLK